MVDVVGRAVIKIESQLDQKSFGAVGSGFRKALVPAIAALGALGVASVKAIHAASDLNEQVSKSGVIFGKQSGEIRKFADSAAQSLGLSSRAALEASSNFGIIAQGAGLTGKAASSFSKQFTTLAGDLASFSNTSTDEAITAIGAALRGESEPIRKYGVLLDDATLRAQALKMGLIATTKDALTPQQKALAASQVILAQTTKAQGDFARTSQSAANQARILAAQSENLSAKLGARLLPAYIAVQKVALKALEWMSQHQTAVTVLAGAVAGLALAVVAVNIAMALLAANPVALALGAIVVVAGAFVAVLAVLYQKSETFRQGIKILGDEIQRVWRTYFGPALHDIHDLWKQVLRAMDDISPTIRNTILPALAKLGSAAVLAPIIALGKAFAYIARSLDAVATAINSVDGSLLDKILKVYKDPRGTLGKVGQLSPQVAGARASGGPINFAGRYLVNERGPELIDLPKGAYVHNASDTRKMSAAPGSSSFTQVNNYFGPVTGSDKKKEMDWTVRFAPRFGVSSAVRA